MDHPLLCRLDRPTSTLGQACQGDLHTNSGTTTSSPFRRIQSTLPLLPHHRHHSDLCKPGMCSHPLFLYVLLLPAVLFPELFLFLSFLLSWLRVSWLLSPSSSPLALEFVRLLLPLMPPHSVLAVSSPVL